MDSLVKQVNVVAVIPARGGSKSIPRKNIKPLAGHPLLAYSIAAGLNAHTVDRVIVSTDDKEIAEIARQYGAEVPFLRPAHLASDAVRDISVFEHALAWFREQEGSVPDVFVQLRPTSPIRPAGLVDRAVNVLLSSPGDDSVRSVVESKQTPYKMWQLEDNRLLPLLETDLFEPYNMPRQELPRAYWQTGHVDVFWARTIVERKSLTGSRVLPCFVSLDYCVDIDTLRDWQQAERLIATAELEMTKPAIKPSTGSDGSLPESVALIVLDFDGVLTDNRVLVHQDGTEAVFASRADGLGISQLRRNGMRVVVLSAETNPVVTARCAKLQIECCQSIGNKVMWLKDFVTRQEISLDSVVYVGNDLPDLGCMQVVGCGVAVADAHPAVLRHADIVLARPGGYGAVRELSDMILSQRGQNDQRNQDW